MKTNLKELQDLIGYTFKNQSYLLEALTHSSYVNENRSAKEFPKDNERLEFFGDAIIEFLVSEYLFEKHKDIPEGDLTKLRASLVCEQSLAQCSKDINLGSYLLMGKGEEASGGRERPSITSDAFEALTAAIYLDSDLENAKQFIYNHLLKAMENKKLFFDAKTKLQEIVQQDPNAVLRYEMLSEEGPGHNRAFIAAVYLNDQEIGRGRGRSKKSAQQDAADQAITNLENRQV